MTDRLSCQLRLTGLIFLNCNNIITLKVSIIHCVIPFIMIIIITHARGLTLMYITVISQSYNTLISTVTDSFNVNK